MEEDEQYESIAEDEVGSEVGSLGEEEEEVTDNIEDIDISDDASYVSSLNNHKIKNNSNTIVSIDETYNQYYSNEKKTKPFLTKFEKAKIIGVRAEMLSSGSNPMIKIDSSFKNAYDIALKEFEQKKIPLLIRRTLPNGDKEDWRLDELIY